MLQKTRKGATSMIVIIFFTLLAGILVLSFVGVMLSNITQSTNYDLSQSAYDAALAGIEDAKIMLLEYNNCMARGKTTGECANIISSINSANSEEDCDIIRKALNRPTNSDKNETLIRSDSTNINNSPAAENLDMAYTCVLVSTDVADYLGTIQNDSDMKVIPLRTHMSGEEKSAANTVMVQWFSSNDYTKISDANNGNAYSRYNKITSISDGKFTNNKQQATSQSYNKFATEATLPPVLNVGLIQTGATFRLNDFYSNDSGKTNRGRLTLRPTLNGSTNTQIDSSVSTGFAASAIAGSYLKTENSGYGYDKSGSDQNSPYDIHCLAGDKIQNTSYACTVYIRLPEAIGASTSDVTRFLTLSTPYSSPEFSFSVTMYNCPTSPKWEFTNECKVVDFVGVQSSVDSTGRANDVFRRIDARVELVDTGYPFPKYAVGLHGDDDAILTKSYETTLNCWDIDNGSKKTCNDLQEVKAAWAN